MMSEVLYQVGDKLSPELRYNLPLKDNFTLLHFYEKQDAYHKPQI